MENSSRGRIQTLLVTASSLTGLSYIFMINKSIFTWFTDMFRWCPTSNEALTNAEAKLLSLMKKPYELSFVSVKHENEDCSIRTITINSDLEKEVPLVLLHGFASGIGLWILNIDDLAEGRPLYALDILGFGHSSRPSFSKDAEIAENQLIESIEKWREKMGLSQFILFGHSMGGFLAASYAIKYPDHVKHLILADPWGFPTPDSGVKKVEFPMWAKAIAAMLRPFNPLAGLRAAGPWGPQLVSRLRPDLLHKFKSCAEPEEVSDYIYHCNAQYPSGETAFKAMSAPFGWAKRPMIKRISMLRQDVPISFIYGSRSWIDSKSGHHICDIRADSIVEVKLIEGAGHHLYADKFRDFNKTVVSICEKVSKGSKEIKNHSLSESETVPQVCI
ncbi:(Lyso)-N-acylphosphatidylethanolamine lipase [Parasteatoda tepidariorum]|uniref:(Lyso)-N-acylphosphatidylethanolamine lipase n=1 Tax=Parasteatoda tepidariorum TaxID=114398 RepID=UPI001C72550F|nr:(Lyso)-N-acylphosphatidylethanolamine lipase [Parasteatoda tepidariorum]